MKAAAYAPTPSERVRLGRPLWAAPLAAVAAPVPNAFVYCALGGDG